MKRVDDVSRETLQFQLDERRQLWIDTLSHARHDWLNDLQLILGYVQLKKYDKISGCVDMLKQRLARESRTGRLGNLGLIELLLTYRAAKLRPFRMEWGLDDGLDLRGLPHVGEVAGAAVGLLLSAVEAAAEGAVRGTDNALDCFFYQKETDAALHVCFQYEGSYDQAALLRRLEEIRRLLNKERAACRISCECRQAGMEIGLRIGYM